MSAAAGVMLCVLSRRHANVTCARPQQSTRPFFTTECPSFFHPPSDICSPPDKFHPPLIMFIFYTTQLAFCSSEFLPRHLWQIGKSLVILFLFNKNNSGDTSCGYAGTSDAFWTFFCFNGLGIELKTWQHRSCQWKKKKSDTPAGKLSVQWLQLILSFWLLCVHARVCERLPCSLWNQTDKSYRFDMSPCVLSCIHNYAFKFHLVQLI